MTPCVVPSGVTQLQKGASNRFADRMEALSSEARRGGAG